MRAEESLAGAQVAAVGGGHIGEAAQDIVADWEEAAGYVDEAAEEWGASTFYL